MKPPAANCPAMSSSAIVAFLIVCCCPGVHCQTDLGEAELYRPLLNDLLSALVKTVEFFASNFQFVNIDAVFCMRLCEGSLTGILADCDSERLSCSQELPLDIAAIIDKFNNIAQQANSYTKDPPNLDAKLPSIFSLGLPLVCLCVCQMAAVPRCTVSDRCGWFMTREGAGRYYLTHQLLYMMVGEKIGCESELEQFLESQGTTLRGFERHLCENIYYDTLSLSRDGTVALKYQDLFLEQIGFCGMLGFENFFNESWIPLILDWQTPLGCFTDRFPHWSADKWADEGETQITATQQVFEHAKHRRKRSEKRMPDGCLSHKTGVATLAMGAYIRYLVSKVYAKV